MSNDDKHRARLINAMLERVDVDALVGQVDLDVLRQELVEEENQRGDIIDRGGGLRRSRAVAGRACP